MKTLKMAIGSVKTVAYTLIMFLFSLSVNAQNNTGQGNDDASHSQQANDYLHSIEKEPNAYTPNSAAWYSQPWIWAIVLAILILIIGLLYKSYGKRDIKSERGL